MDALATEAPSTASLRWSGHWIGHQARTAAGTPADFLTGGGAGRSFSRSMFRRTFDLEVVPEEAPARITADSRYVLWVNGQEVGRGPARSQPFRQRYDSYDLAPYLTRRRQRRRCPGDLLRPGDVVLAAGSGWFQHRCSTRLRSADRRSDPHLRRQLASPALRRVVAAGRFQRRRRRTGRDRRCSPDSSSVARGGLRRLRLARGAAASGHSPG